MSSVKWGKEDEGTTQRPTWIFGHCDFYTNSLALGQSSTKAGKPQLRSGTPSLGKGLKGSELALPYLPYGVNLV